MSGIVSKMQASLPQIHVEEKSTDIQSVLMAGGQPQAVFIPTPPLEQTSKKNKSLKHINAKQIKQLIEFLNAVGKSQSGLNQVLASPILAKKYFEEDMIQEVDNLNWLYPEIVPHKYGVKRRHNVSNEYRAVVHNLQKLRLGLNEFPVLNDNSIPQLVKIYTERANNAAILSALGSSNITHTATTTSRVADGGAHGRVNNLTVGANNSPALIQNRADSATAGSSQASRVASETVKSSLGSYRDLNASNVSSYGATRSSLVSAFVKDQRNGFLKGLSPSELSSMGSAGYIRSYQASKSLVGDNQGMAGSRFGSFISVIPSRSTLAAGDHSSSSNRSVEFMKQPCVCLFKAVDPPPCRKPWQRQVQVNLTRKNSSITFN